MTFKALLNANNFGATFENLVKVSKTHHAEYLPQTAAKLLQDVGILHVTNVPDKRGFSVQKTKARARCYGNYP